MSIQKNSPEEYGLWIVTRVMQKKYITLKENGLSFDGKKHGVKGVRFSQELKQDPEIVSNLKEISRGYLRLYYFLEEDGGLSVSAEKAENPESAAAAESDIDGENTPEPLTGMSFLSLFEQDLLFLNKTGEKAYTLVYDSAFAGTLPDPETTLTRVFEDIVRFAEDDPAAYELTLESANGFRTEDLSDDLSVTSCFDEEAYMDLNWEDIPAEIDLNTESDDDGLLIAFEENEKTERELIVEKNMEDTLKRLSRMISDIDEGAGEVRSDSSRYTLTFNDHETAACSLFTAEIPDGFRAETDIEDLHMILWLPNPDNPEEWEASVAVLTAESIENTGDSDADGETLHCTASGQKLRFTCLKRTGAGETVRFTADMIGVETNKQPEAEAMIRRILSGITMR